MPKSQWGGRKKKVEDVPHLQTALSPDFADKLLTGKKTNTNARN